VGIVGQPFGTNVHTAVWTAGRAAAGPLAGAEVGTYALGTGSRQRSKYCVCTRLAALAESSVSASDRSAVGTTDTPAADRLESSQSCLSLSALARHSGRRAPQGMASISPMGCRQARQGISSISRRRSYTDRCRRGDDGSWMAKRGLVGWRGSTQVRGTAGSWHAS
jgi:hypothetical protein